MTAVFASVRLRRVPARRPGNFHLLAQMKVTKAKGRNTDLDGMLGRELKRSLAHRRTSDRYLGDPSSRCDFIDRKSPLRVGVLQRSAPRVTRSRGPAANRSKFEPHEIRRRNAASKSARKRSEPRGGAKPRALTSQTSGQIGIQALCFGDFHLCQQMKVTRPPGRDPATNTVNRHPGRNPATPR